MHRGRLSLVRKSGPRPLADSGHDSGHMVAHSETIWKSIGGPIFRIADAEQASLVVMASYFGRSFFSTPA
jgi:hypothetical protein